MVRVNVGIDPCDLTDEHLRAENVELQMLITWAIKYPEGYIPEKFSLGTGHISFFRDKLKYIFNRLNSVQGEMVHRDMKVNICYLDIWFSVRQQICTFNYKNYNPTKEDAKIVAERLVDRILYPKKQKTSPHYNGKSVNRWEFIARYNPYSRTNIIVIGGN